MMLLPSYKHEMELKTPRNQAQNPSKQRHQTLVPIHECQIMIDVKA